MSPLLTSTLLKFAIPIAVTAAILFMARLRGVRWKDDLGLHRPPRKPFLCWIAFWVVWMAAIELLISALGLEQPKPWPEYPALIIALRILTIGVLGPFTEELAMRGIVLDRLRRLRLGAAGAVLVTSVLWAGLHTAYGPGTVALIALDGMLFGAARLHTGSLWTPVAMHVLGNLFSIWQSTHS